MKKIDDVLIENAGKALHITTTLKSWLESNTAIVITDLIPGQWDNQVRNLAIQGLRLAVESLGLLQTKNLSTAEVVQKSLAVIKALPPAAAESKLAKISSTILKTIDGQRVSDNVYDLAAQTVYSLSK